MKSIEPIDDMERRAIESEPTSALISELFDDTKALMLEELHRSKLELMREVEKAKSATKAMVIGGVGALVTTILFGIALIAVLSEFMAPWIAALIVTAVYGIGSMIAIRAGVKTMKRLEPSRAIEPIKEEGRWIKETVRDVRSHKEEHTLH
jgi:hypothetical protein